MTTKEVYILVEKINERLLKEYEKDVILHGFKLKNIQHFDEDLFLDEKTKKKIDKYTKNTLKDYFGSKKNGKRN